MTTRYVSQNRSSEVIAINNAVRYLFSAGASAYALPLIEKVGVGVANTIAAALVWAGFLLIIVTIRNGETLRRHGEKWEGTASGALDGRAKTDEEAHEKTLTASDTDQGSKAKP